MKIALPDISTTIQTIIAHVEEGARGILKHSQKNRKKMKYRRCK